MATFDRLRGISHHITYG